MISLALGLASVISVLAFGGVQVLGFIPAELIVCAAALVAFGKAGHFEGTRFTKIVSGILLALTLLQILPLPESLLSLLSHGRSKIMGELAAAQVTPSPTLSVVPYETFFALLRLACYVLAFLLGTGAYRCEKRVKLPGILIAVGLLESLYGLVQYFADWQYIYALPKMSSFSMASGTYINYNHFAGLLEMVLPFLIVALWLTPSDSNRNRWSDLLMRPEIGTWILNLAFLVVVFLALIFSQSRSGIVGGIAGMAVAAFLGIPRSGRALILLPILAAITLLLSFSLWLGLSPVMSRFQDTTIRAETEQGRPLIWKDTLSSIRDFPTLGTGLGTYHSVSRYYQTAPGSYRYEHAHNDYLEFASDLGIPASLLLFGSLWVLALKIARKSLLLERMSQRRLAAACAGAMIALLIHSLTDFNLQIPANALIFSWISGTGAGILSFSRGIGLPLLDRQRL